MKRDHILEKVNENGIYLHDKLMKALGNHRHVGEIRHIGLINAIELVENKETKKLLIRKSVSAGISSGELWIWDWFFDRWETLFILIHR